MSAIEELIQTVAALRDPETGCPWDIEQDHRSIANCLVDECCELLQTIDRLDMDHMKEELGDVLLQVVMHAQMAKESGAFDFEAVCRDVNGKLIRRHPHVFEGKCVADSEEVLAQWDQIKATEKKRASVRESRFKDLPTQLPALMFAQSVCKQIQKQNMSADEAIDRVAIDPTKNHMNEEILGQKLFEIAAGASIRGLDAESALRRYTRKLMDTLDKAKP